MNEWKLIWNSFCDEVAVSVKKNNLEKVFEEGIAKDFLSALDWNRFNKGVVEQYQIKFGTATHRADFALFAPGEDYPTIIVELKRPQKKKEEKDAKQLLDYMRQKSCSFGVLLLGTKMEIYFINYNSPQHEASLVETIKYQHDNDAARLFMEVLFRREYSFEKMREYCNKRIKINKSIDYWCSADGNAEILNMIIERSKLSEQLSDSLRQTLSIEVKRVDGLQPLAPHKIVESVTTPDAPPASSTPKEGEHEPRVWMISANPKFFDHRACFEELGHIYWKQNNNLQVGDIGYIYFSKPYQRIVFKYEVVACDLPFSDAVLPEKKFYTKEKDFEATKEHNRLFLMKKVGETASDQLTLANMLQHGMKAAPLGAFKLSDKMFEELLAFIESNF